MLALTALAEAGVDARVLKGVAIAHLDHADPDERVYGDADLLVERGEYRPALAALIGAGFRRARPPVRGWREHRFAKAVVLHAPSGGGRSRRTRRRRAGAGRGGAYHLDRPRFEP